MTRGRRSHSHDLHIAQSWPLLEPERGRGTAAWSTLTLSHPSCCWGDACPTGIMLGHQLVEIRVSPLNLGPHSQLPWASETLGSYNITENRTWILLSLSKDASLVPPSSSPCSDELRESQSSVKVPELALRAAGCTVCKRFLTHNYTHSPFEHASQSQAEPRHRTPWTQGNERPKKKTKSEADPREGIFHSTSPPDWLEKDVGKQQLVPNQRCVHVYINRVSANCLCGTPKYPQYHYKSFLPASQHSPARSISHFPHKNDRLTLSSHLHKSPTDNHKYFSYADLWQHKQD